MNSRDIEKTLNDNAISGDGTVLLTLSNPRSSAPVVGPGAERLPARIILGRPPLRVRGANPPVQVVHVDDLVTALALAATTDLPGVYNVAADGWLASDDARALVGRINTPGVPEELLTRALRRAWVLGVGDIPPGLVPYLVHPWVIENARLRAQGWVPRHTNEDAIAEAAAALAAAGRGVDVRVLAAGAGAAGAAVVTTAAIVVRRKRRRTPA